MSAPVVAVFCMCQRGHLHRLRPLVSALAARGAVPHVFTDRRLADDVRACGGRFEDLFAEHALREADDTSAPAPFRYVTFAGRFAGDIADRVAQLGPSLVVYDSFAMIGRAVARRLDVPYVNVCAGHNVHPRRLRELLPTIPPTHPSPRCLDAASSLSTEMAIAYGDPFTYLCAPSPHLNVYCEPPEFLTPDERTPFEPAAFFGSLDPPRAEAAGNGTASGFPDDPPGAPKVFVSFGTVNWRYWPSEATRALRAIVSGLTGARARVLVSLGGHRETLGSIPSELTRPNVRVADYVDQWAVLRDADAFITHHGLNSTHEAIYHGVPMLSCPFIWDQPALARRCQEFGLALPLGDGVRAAPEPATVSAALERLCDEREARAARLAVAREWEDRVMAGRSRVVQRILDLA
jgi:MGT family glycosyltransferase